MRIFLVFIFLLLLLLPAVAGNADDFVESQLNKGIKNSEPYSYMALQEKGSDSMVSKALLSSPDLPAVYFSLAKASFSLSGRGILDSIDFFIQGIVAYSRNFFISFSFTAVLFFSVLVSFLIAFAILILLRLLTDIKLIAHDFREGNLSPVILLVPLVCAPLNPLLCLGAILILLGLYMRRVDRVLVYAFLLVLVFSPLLFRTGFFFLNGLSSGKVKAVAEVNNGKGNLYATTALKGKENHRELFSYAVALKREGRCEEAIPAFQALIKMKPDPKSYIELGNCFVGLYNFEEDKKQHLQNALEAYQEAVRLKPTASAYYNLSQISREMFDYRGGNEYFNSALALDRDAVASYISTNARNSNRFVVDEPLSSADLWKYARDSSSHRYDFGFGRSPLISIPVGALLLIALFYYLALLTNKRAYRCKKCGIVLCPQCEKRLVWGQLCPQCYGSLLKPDELDMKERVLRLLEIHGRQNRRRTIMKALSLILPGTPQVYAGRLMNGFLWMWPFLFFLIVPFLDSALTLENIFFGNAVVKIISFFSAGFLYLAANMLTRERISKGWL